ncbi:hypothetical protein DXG03_008641 [Asterophora parasitica]|uniref:Deuterolysin n=1 Tax=Asterophora parasitica TaxID=117018 RepID=A0A9P7G7I0_9AGAR|nr:hypothetical protein DXG03_008641 [Asterophora parasitica]
MFRAALLLSLATVALGLSSGDLKVTLNAVSSSVSSVDDIVISAVISNPTDKDIRVIAKNNILDTSATRSFTVKKDGKDVLFAGIRVRRLFPLAHESTDATPLQATFDLTANGVYKTIPARSSIAVNHTGLGALYDFETFGTGAFNFEANKIFLTGPNTSPLVVDAPAVIVEVTDDVQKRLLLSPSLSNPTCSDGNKLNVIRTSLAEARAMAGGAATDIKSHPNSAEFKTYFGNNNRDDIWWRMDIIAGDLASSGTPLAALILQRSVVVMAV